MAPPPGRPLPVPSSFDCTAVPPSPLTSGPSATLSSASSPPYSRFFLCPSSPATSSPRPFFFELSDPPEGLFSSQTAPTTEPTASYSTTWATFTSNASPPEDTHASLPRVPHPSGISSLPSLPASPQLVTACDTHQSRQVNLTLAAAAPFVEGYKVAATTTWPHATAANLASATREAGVCLPTPSVQRTTSPMSEIAAEEAHSYNFTCSQSDVGFSEGLSSTHQAKSSPEHSRSSLPTFLCGKRSCSTSAAAAAPTDATGWGAATHSCYLDIEACHSFAHRVPSGLRTCYSLQGRTLLSPPAVEISPPLEETEAVHAGLRLDSPMLSRSSSPCSLRSCTRHDQTEKCNVALTSTFPETFMSTSQKHPHRPYSNYHLPLLFSVVPKSLDTFSSQHCSPCSSQIWETDTNEVHPVATEPIHRATPALESQNPKAIQAISAAPDVQTPPSEGSGILIQQANSPKYNTRRILQLMDRSEIAVTDGEHVTVGISKKGPIFSPASFAAIKNKNRRKGTAALSSWPFLQKRKSKGCAGSLQMCCQQTSSEASADRKGTYNRKRRRGTSSPSRQENTVTLLKKFVQEEVQPLVPAAVMTAPAVTACTQRHTATGLDPSSAVHSPSASPAVPALAPSPITADSVPPTGDCSVSSLSVAPAAVHGPPTTLLALHATGSSAAVDNTEALSATFSRSETPTATGGAAADAAARSGRLACAAVDDSTPLSSAATAMPTVGFHSGPTVAAQHLAPSPHTDNCMAHGNTAVAGSVSPAAVVAALTAAARSSLSPGAVGYALAVKLFGFTPTPGFLPDPNPFDKLDQYLLRGLKSTTVTTCSSNMKLESTNTSAVHNLRMPPLVTTKCASDNRTSSTPSLATPKWCRSGYPDAPVERLVNPPTQRVTMHRNTIVAKSDGKQYDHLASVCGSGGENTLAVASFYTLSSPPATATAAPAHCDDATSAVHHSQSRVAAVSLSPVNGSIEDSTRSAQRPAAVKDESQPFFTTSHTHHEGPVKTNGQRARSAAYSAARSFVNETGYLPARGPQEEAVATGGQMQGSCQGRQGSHPHGMEKCAHCIAPLKSRVLTFDKDQTGYRYYVQDERDSTVYEAYHLCEGQGTVLHGGCNVHAAQFSQSGSPDLSHMNLADEERQFECVARRYNIGGEVLGSEPRSSSLSLSYERGPISTGASTQERNNIQATEGLQFGESSVYASYYLQGDKCLVPALPPHSRNSCTRDTPECKDRTSEPPASVTGEAKVYSSVRNTSSSTRLCSVLGGTRGTQAVHPDAAAVPVDTYSRTYE